MADLLRGCAPKEEKNTLLVRLSLLLELRYLTLNEPLGCFRSSTAQSHIAGAGSIWFQFVDPAPGCVFTFECESQQLCVVWMHYFAEEATSTASPPVRYPTIWCQTSLNTAREMAQAHFDTFCLSVVATTTVLYLVVLPGCNLKEPKNHLSGWPLTKVSVSPRFFPARGRHPVASLGKPWWMVGKWVSFEMFWATECVVSLVNILTKGSFYHCLFFFVSHCQSMY